MVVTMAIPTIIAYGLVHASQDRKCQPQLPPAAPWKDLADRWARELDAARATLITRVNSQEQFRW